MNVEQPATANNEADLIFVMPVFAIEFREDGFESGGLWLHVNTVCGGVATLFFYCRNLRFIRPPQLFGRCFGRDPLYIPSLVIDVDLREIFANFVLVAQSDFLVRDVNDRHLSSFRLRLLFLESSELGPEPRAGTPGSLRDASLQLHRHPKYRFHDHAITQHAPADDRSEVDPARATAFHNPANFQVSAAIPYAHGF